MKTNLKIAAAFAGLGLVTSPAMAGDHLSYGLGMATCGSIIDDYSGNVGKLLKMAYIGGYVTGLNTVMGELKDDGQAMDISNSENMDSLTRMVTTTCKAHKIFTFEQAISKVVLRIQKQTKGETPGD